MTSLADIVGVEKLGPNEFVSKVNPIRMGNSMPIAYGGCAIASAIRSATETVPAGFTPYSVLGHFLGPASTDQKLFCTVHEIRSTRTFATRRVQVRQKQKDGSLRSCMEATVDFHIVEPSAADFSAPPATAWPSYHDCPPVLDHAESLMKRGVLSETQYKVYLQSTGISGSLFEARVCTNGVSGQNLAGTAKHAVTTQDGLPITSKTSAEWQRTRSKLETPQANVAATGFIMDGGLSFAPLTHDHRFFDDVGACSTLDFALRIFVPEIDLNAWTLRERFTTRGAWGRTYSEGRMFDDKGQMMASMTQQCILRPKPKPKSDRAKM